MQCPKCQLENLEGKKFCQECGSKLALICPNCRAENLPTGKFCGDCGQRLEKETPSKEKSTPPSESERKYITVLFSDMSGYTSMAEKLDPEEVKEIMGRIFGEIAQVVVKYEGFIEKFIGDAIMALFGVPKSHEDDPIRAIRAAREIHDIVASLSPRYEKHIGKPLAMHTGICTGLVVTGEVNLEKGTHGVLGDTINSAARLSGVAKSGEIVVSPETHHQAEGYFTFEPLEATIVKGKADPIKPYKVLSSNEEPITTHRLSGIRAELIGRKAEMAQLQEAITNLRQGKGSILSIVGDAGTGKSRLIEDFKASLNLDEIQWREGHCYAYAQNIPYFPLIDLLSRAWRIRESDAPEQIKQKVADGSEPLLGERKDLIPYVGSLYSLKYTEIENVSPENWKNRLHEAIQLILANLCRLTPAIICIEDLHWADPSTVELLRKILSDFRYPAVFLCIYRPEFSLFPIHHINAVKLYHEIRLHDLSPTDAQSLVESLLKTKTIPHQLQMFIRDKADGNPFYLEEVINSLIETGTLLREKDSWILSRSLNKNDIPSTVQGVISARLDRLERETKRILQEASVIGRAFLYEILKRVSDVKGHIDKSLVNLERVDLIKTRSLHPELEYIFKHALTQEVVYNGLLIKERHSIHEKIGQVIEELFHDHLPEVYETLAYHFSHSENTQKAYQYLLMSGGKAAKNYANNEVIRFYLEAIRMLDAQPESLENKKEKLKVHLMMTTPFTYLSYPEGCLEIFQNAEKLAQELGNEESLIQIQGSLSLYYTITGKPDLGLEYAERCFNSAVKLNDYKLMTRSAGRVCAAYLFTGDVAKVVEIGGKAISSLEEQHLEKEFFGMGSSPYSFICSYYGVALGWMGKLKDGTDVLEKGNRNAAEVNDKYHVGLIKNMHSILTYFAGYGDNTIEYAQEAIKIYEEADISIGLEIAWSLIGGGYCLRGEHRKAIDPIEKSLLLAKKLGLPFAISWCYWFLAMALWCLDNMKRAKECAREALIISQDCGLKSCEGMTWVILGSMMTEATPSSNKEAQRQIRHGISILEDCQLKLLSSIGHLHLGEFCTKTGEDEAAFESLKKAETLYREMDISPQSHWLIRTKDALNKLESGTGTT